MTKQDLAIEMLDNIERKIKKTDALDFLFPDNDDVSDSDVLDVVAFLRELLIRHIVQTHTPNGVAVDEVSE